MEIFGTQKVHFVYKDDENRFYSDGIERAFGDNCNVEISKNESIFVCVMPLKCDPDECGLKLAGIMKASV